MRGGFSLWHRLQPAGAQCTKAGAFRPGGPPVARPSADQACPAIAAGCRRPQNPLGWRAPGLMDVRRHGLHVPQGWKADR
jgi:hypothetical protein